MKKTLESLKKRLPAFKPNQIDFTPNPAFNEEKNENKYQSEQPEADQLHSESDFIQEDGRFDQHFRDYIVRHEAEKTHGGMSEKTEISKVNPTSEGTPTSESACTQEEKQDVISKFRQHFDNPSKSQDTLSTSFAKTNTETVPSVGELQNTELEVQQQIREEESNTLSNVTKTEFALLEEASQAAGQEERTSGHYHDMEDESFQKREIDEIE